MRLIKTAILLALLLTGWLGVQAIEPESLNYVVTYKWGLIHKEAGTAHLTVRNAANGRMAITLTARTKSWADKFFKVRDTLYSLVDAKSLRPVKYVKTAHEDGAYSREEISYSYPPGGVVLAEAKRARRRKKDAPDAPLSHSKRTLSAAGQAFDFLSAFYYVRALDFANMSPGKQYKTTVFSGKLAETLTLSVVGKERITLRDKSKAEAWKVRFRFTSTEGGKKKTSDDIEAWVSTAPGHKVLQLIGQLPVGQVRVYLVN